MKQNLVIGITANLIFIALLSGCDAAAPGIQAASASQQPPAVQWPAPRIENDKGDGSFKTYDYH